jgi:hypothetical protein
MVTTIFLKRTVFFIAILLLLLAAACTKDTESSYGVQPVVESYLIPGRNAEVRVSLQKQLVDTNAYGTAISGLSLQISDGTGAKMLTEDKPGHYILDDPSFVKSGGTYSLAFTYNNVQVTASTIMPSKPSGIRISDNTFTIPTMVFGTEPTVFDPVNITWNNTALDNHLLVFKCLENPKVLISSRYNTDTISSVEANVTTAATFELNQRMFRYFGHYKVILMHVNPEYVDMLNSSSTSSQNLTNAPTNVKNGLGIFTAMQTDTLSSNLLVKSEN